MECIYFEGNDVWKENNITVSQEPRLESSPGRNRKKINELLTHISTNNITELNDLIYAWEKLIRENQGSPKEQEQKLKTWMGN